jgi:hypothetical protein
MPEPVSPTSASVEPVGTSEGRETVELAFLAAIST